MDIATGSGDVKSTLEKAVRSDRSFNPARVPVSASAKKLVADVAQQLESYEDHFGLRKRKRKQVDQATFLATVSAVICDLVHLHLMGVESALFASRSNQTLGHRSRYRSPVLGKRLPAVLDLMAKQEMSFVEQVIGQEGYFGSQRRTTIKAGRRLISRIVELDLGLDDLAIATDQETIQLKSAKDDYWGRTKLVEYSETPETRGLRQEMAKLNAWLEACDVSFDIGALKDPDRDVDERRRSQRRSFTQGSFQCGGRMWGGFWLDLSKRDRFNSIKLDSEPVAELDFGQMSIRTVYGMMREVPDFEDAYAVPGFLDHRSAMKLVVNSMLFSTSRLSRMPKGGRKELHSRHTIAAVMAAIETAHDPIRSSFFHGIGHRAQRIESDIIIAVVLGLKKLGIPALPIHDAILVPHSKAVTSERLMLSTFYSHTGVAGVVSVTTLEDIHRMN